MKLLFFHSFSLYYTTCCSPFLLLWISALALLGFPIFTFSNCILLWCHGIFSFPSSQISSAICSRFFVSGSFSSKAEIHESCISGPKCMKMLVWGELLLYPMFIIFVQLLYPMIYFYNGGFLFQELRL